MTLMYSVHTPGGSGRGCWFNTHPYCPEIMIHQNALEVPWTTDAKRLEVPWTTDAKRLEGNKGSLPHAPA
jgi:hypothetical protein